MCGAGAALEKVGADEGTRGYIYGLVQGEGGSKSNKQAKGSIVRLVSCSAGGPGRGERKHNAAPLE